MDKCRNICPYQFSSDNLGYFEEYIDLPLGIVGFLGSNFGGADFDQPGGNGIGRPQEADIGNTEIVRSECITYLLYIRFQNIS